MDGRTLERTYVPGWSWREPQIVWGCRSRRDEGCEMGGEKLVGALEEVGKSYERLGED